MVLPAYSEALIRAPKDTLQTGFVRSTGHAWGGSPVATISGLRGLVLGYGVEAWKKTKIPMRGRLCPETTYQRPEIRMRLPSSFVGLSIRLSLPGTCCPTTSRQNPENPDNTVGKLYTAERQLGTHHVIHIVELNPREFAVFPPRLLAQYVL